MKKYLTLAAVLGAIAFLSVSYLAQADSDAVATQVDAAVTEAKDAAAVTTQATEGAPAVEGKIDLAKITEECKTEAAKDKADGTKPSAEENTAAFAACLKAKTNAAMEETKPVDPAATTEGADHAEHTDAE